jgi:SAM-dependent methyltransferase
MPGGGRWVAEGAISKLARWWLGRRETKRFSGSSFDRLAGLDPLLEAARGVSVLDIGSCDGLVSYEFARRGARLVHGFERDPSDVHFARRLFRDVPVEWSFTEADLAVTGREIERRHGSGLLERYDVVLFLGVYHHFARQMGRAELDGLVEFLLGRTARFFAVRTPRLDDLDPQVLAAGFEQRSEHPAHGRVGPLRVYERQPGSAR